MPETTGHAVRNPKLSSCTWRHAWAGSHSAALRGGCALGANRAHPAEFFYDNLMTPASTCGGRRCGVGVPLLHEAWRAGVSKFVALGMVCAYPEFTPVPFRWPVIFSVAMGRKLTVGRWKGFVGSNLFLKESSI